MSISTQPIAKSQIYNLWGDAYGELGLNSASTDELISDVLTQDEKIILDVSSKPNWNRTISADAEDYHVYLYVRHQLLSRTTLLTNPSGGPLTLKAFRSYTEDNAYRIEGPAVNLGHSLEFSLQAQWRLMVVNPQTKFIYAWTSDQSLNQGLKRKSLVRGILYLESRDIGDDAWFMDLESPSPCIVVHEDLKELYQEILHMQKNATLIAQSAFSYMLDDILLNKDREERLWHKPFLKSCCQLIEKYGQDASYSNSILQLQEEDLSVMDILKWKEAALKSWMRHIQQKQAHMNEEKGA